ncbi:XRE family transcriptional regulator [Staphylococcus delphini]|uniref:helix-turn-helix domain-containing protein n=1 Tax=Staphylococcus delphini TaxID=53344 RepID=UPI0021D10275|nr:XRE family transcriptional regulator [Staphylococcus delphini]UXS29515.1 XRE family transcriptional regulator [Staphylococcus delphini]UXS37188.1 XRE family transcriptional regulator [Staphylococcus delphini]UXS44646.1 XRE family transcriptional regulator [Staphylococcus delphini]UXV45272.1 XRE family transcriptional regulator [Staphylococcus delphini]
MENINTVVAENLQYYRQAHRLSLDKIAQLTGISKTMISQIEKGAANPSINTLWKIANGLRIPLTSLISEENEAIQKIDRSDIQPIYNDDRSVVVYPYFPYEAAHAFEMFCMRMDADSILESDAHQEGAKEYIIVNEGTLTLTVGDTQYEIEAGQAISFNANTAHTYRNQTGEELRITATIQY